MISPWATPLGSTKRTHPDRSACCTYFAKIEVFRADFALEHIVQKVLFRFFRQNPPPVQVKNLPPIQKSCFQLVHISVNPIKKIWMEKLVATLRTTFLKMPTRHPACLYVGWRFSPKHQKSFDFRIPMRFLIQIFFIGPEIHYTLW